jgi:hypothetical protein
MDQKTQILFLLETRRESHKVITINKKNEKLRFKTEEKIYSSGAGTTKTGFSKLTVSSQTVFLPLNAEQMAAAKHRMAAIMNAAVNAVMNGPDMALGKKV